MSTNSAIENFIFRNSSLEYKIKHGLVDADAKFDPFLRLSLEKADEIAEWADTLIRSNRTRAPKPADLDRYRLALEVVVANALAAHRQGRPCRYSRGKSAYDPKLVPVPANLTVGAVVYVVDRLVEHGFLKGVIAPPNPTSGEASTFAAEPSLLKAIGEPAGNSSVIYDNPDRPAIILKGADKKLLNIEPNQPEIAAMIERVDRYNAYMRNQYVEIPGSKGSLMWAPYSNLFRVFNNGSFQDGGRYFGGAWQLIGKRRSEIRINGEETIELDFGGFMPRGLYHLIGLEYLDDPYELIELKIEVERAGMNWIKVRNALKVFFMKLLNSSNKRGLLFVKRGDDYIKIPISLPNGMDHAGIMKALIEKHKPIEGCFFKMKCFELMNYESIITEAILSKCVEFDIPVLPIHDSYIVRKPDEHFLRDVMRSAYHSKFNKYPIIK